MLTRRKIRRTVGQALFIGTAAATVVAVSLLAPRYVSEFGIIVVPLALLAFAAVAVLLLVPVEVLPALALTVFALLPARLLPQDGPLGALPVTTIILVVWAGRRIFLGQGNDTDTIRAGALSNPPEREPFKAAAVISGALFLVWAAFSLIRSIDFQASAGWLISFTAGALLPLIVGRATREAIWIRRTWLMLGGWLGAYAVVEAALQTNPLWGNLYAVLGVTDAQHWSVYRAEASFGHPLFAALFFAVACAMAVGIWLTHHSRWTLAAGIFSGLGLVASVSRGAMLGGAVAVMVAYLVSLVISGEKRWGRFAWLAVLGVVGIVGIFQFDAFTSRNESTEAALSSGARDTGVWVAGQVADLTNWLGSGAGTSGISGRLFDDVVIENSLLQLLMSVGLPGLILFVGFIGAAFLHALSRGAVGDMAGLLAYAICISGFNAIDALRPMHLLLGCLIILTLNPGVGVSLNPGARVAPDRALRRAAAPTRTPLPARRNTQNA
jgi:hypothetical protein